MNELIDIDSPIPGHRCGARSYVTHWHVPPILRRGRSQRDIRIRESKRPLRARMRFWEDYVHNLAMYRARTFDADLRHKLNVIKLDAGSWEKAGARVGVDAEVAKMWAYRLGSPNSWMQLSRIDREYAVAIESLSARRTALHRKTSWFSRIRRKAEIIIQCAEAITAQWRMVALQALGWSWFPAAAVFISPVEPTPGERKEVAIVLPDGSYFRGHQWSGPATGKRFKLGCAK